MLHKTDSLVPLQQISIRGGLFCRVQDRNYWQFDQYVRVFKPDAAAEQRAFERFVKDYPHSDLAPNAQFWLGNAWYAQKECKKAIDAQLVVTSRWPDSLRAPDAMLAIADCQRDWGNVQAARRTLTSLVAKYPDSKAAAQARQRLGQK